MLLKVVTYIAVAGSIGVIVLGLIWKSLFPPVAYWTPQQAREYQDAFRAVHAAQDAVDRGRLAADASQLRLARERYEQLQLDLSQAQKARDRTGIWLVAIGLIGMLTSIAALQRWPKPAIPRDE